MIERDTELQITTEPAIAYSTFYRLPFLSLFHADCMEIMKQYPDKYFDLAIVDPPYGIERFKNVTTTPSIKDVHAKRFQRMETVNNNKPSDEYWSELFRVSKNQIVWGANNFELPPSEYFLCWNKEQAMPNFATLEYAWVSMGLKKPAKLFTYSIHKHNQVDKVHPTQKPIPLYDWILMHYAKEGDLILDTHFGSGSIALAVDKANRLDKMNLHLTACEIDKEYIDKAIKRISESIKQGTLSF
jgi:site-specific DNA-methyltransferase (adenine-specific)